MPHPWQRSRLARALGVELAELDRLLKPEKPERRRIPEGDVPDAGIGEDHPDEANEILERLQHLQSVPADDPMLRVATLVLDEIARDYEAGTGADVYGRSLQLRRWAEQLIAQSHPYRQRRELLCLAGRLSGLLGYLSFDLGHNALAHAYCEEAFLLAELTGDNELAAWVRGTQSFVAYYRGNYRDALELAVDGQRYATNSVQAVRLAASGEARALGKLGDRVGVDEAVDRALSLGSERAGIDPVGYFLSMSGMGVARVHGNAASAYLSLGCVEESLRHASLAIPQFATVKTARASVALTMIDLSMSYLIDSPSAAPDQAGRLAKEAVAIGDGLRSTIVADRAQSFLDAGARWSDVAEIASVAEDMRTWKMSNDLPAA